MGKFTDVFRIQKNELFHYSEPFTAALQGVYEKWEQDIQRLRQRAVLDVSTVLVTTKEVGEVIQFESHKDIVDPGDSG